MKKTVLTFADAKKNGEKLTMLTAYDCSTAKYFDEAGVDSILVGDSVGMVVLGLASVIIGLSVFKRVTFMKATTMVILGSILYKLCLSAALALGLPTEYLKLLMAVIFTLALVFSNGLGGENRRRLNVRAK